MDDEVTIKLSVREFYALKDAMDLPWFGGEEEELLRANNPTLASAYDKFLEAEPK